MNAVRRGMRTLLGSSSSVPDRDCHSREGPAARLVLALEEAVQECLVRQEETMPAALAMMKSMPRSQPDIIPGPKASNSHRDQSRAYSPPPRLQVNRGTCRFGRYKNARRPHPPRRASRVSHHPPQVSCLTLSHPCSPTLTRSRPPPSRSTNRLRLCGSISGPW